MERIKFVPLEVNIENTIKHITTIQDELSCTTAIDNTLFDTLEDYLHATMQMHAVLDFYHNTIANESEVK